MREKEINVVKTEAYMILSEIGFKKLNFDAGKTGLRSGFQYQV